MAYTTSTDLKTYLGIDAINTADDTLLTALIARAQAIIDAQTGRAFEAAADTARSYSYGSVDCGILFFDGDLCQVTSIVNGDGLTVGAGSYWHLPNNLTPWYAVELKPSTGLAWDGWTADIVVTGRWAYSISAPTDIVQACIRLAAWLYRQRDNAQADQVIVAGNATILPAALPSDVLTIIAQYRRLAI